MGVASDELSKTENGKWLAGGALDIVATFALASTLEVGDMTSLRESAPELGCSPVALVDDSGVQEGAKIRR